MALQSHEPATIPIPNLRVPTESRDDGDLHELLTVEDVAALLKVSRSRVYEHTRTWHGANRATPVHHNRKVQALRPTVRSRVPPATLEDCVSRTT